MTYSDVLKSWAQLCGFPIINGSPESSICDTFLYLFKNRWREAMLAAQWPFAVETFRLSVCDGGICPLADKFDRYILKCYDKDWRIDDSADCLRFKRMKDFLVVPNVAADSPAVVSGDISTGDAFKDENGTLKCQYSQSQSCALSGSVKYSDCVNGNSGFRPTPAELGDVIIDNSGNSYVCFSPTREFSAADSAHFIRLNNGMRGNLYAFSRSKIWDESSPDDSMEVPEQFLIFITRGCQADWLRSQNRNDEAEIPESKARDALAAEVFEAENFQNTRLGINFGIQN